MAVYIRGYGLVSPVGVGLEENIKSFRDNRTNFTAVRDYPEGVIHQSDKSRIVESLKLSDKDLRLDWSSLLALAASSEAAKKADLEDVSCGVIFGSSRGATERLENAFEAFRNEHPVSPVTSPVTTANSIPSTIAQKLKLQGPHLFVSGACSTSMHALGIGKLFIETNQLNHCIVGGSEWANTDFFLQVMANTKVLSKEGKQKFPQKPFSRYRSGMVLSSGAGALVLSNKKESSDFGILGYGAATDHSTLTGVSGSGIGLVKAINNCLSQAEIEAEEIDLIVAHGSATRKGDQAELNAIQEVFKKQIPPITANKWLFGHMLGASAVSSVISAILQLQGTVDTRLPYQSEVNDNYLPTNRTSKALVLSLGFGGNAAALVIQRYGQSIDGD